MKKKLLFKLALLTPLIASTALVAVSCNKKEDSSVLMMRRLKKAAMDSYDLQLSALGDLLSDNLKNPDKLSKEVIEDQIEFLTQIENLNRAISSPKVKLGILANTLSFSNSPEVSNYTKDYAKRAASNGQLGLDSFNSIMTIFNSFNQAGDEKTSPTMGLILLLSALEESKVLSTIGIGLSETINFVNDLIASMHLATVSKFSRLQLKSTSTSVIIDHFLNNAFSLQELPFQNIIKP
jgi:hypothetical protein